MDSDFALEGVKFPTATVDVVRRGEALATFSERDLTTHFQQISKVGGVRRALEIYCRVDRVANWKCAGRRLVQIGYCQPAPSAICQNSV